MTRRFAHPDKITFIKSAHHDAAGDTATIEETVKAILPDVRQHGDATVGRYALQFDKTCPDKFEVASRNNRTHSRLWIGRRARTRNSPSEACVPLQRRN